MGIFGGLFRKSEAAPDSMIIQFVERNFEGTQYEKEMTLRVMFVCFMKMLSTFAEPERKPGNSTTLQGQSLKASIDCGDTFSNDSALFELGCYVFFLNDLWLLGHRPEIRTRVSGGLLGSFVALFTYALERYKPDDLAALVHERLNMYAALSRPEVGAEKCSYHLFQLILRTKEDRKPRHYDFNSDPFVPGSYFWQGLDFGLSTQLMDWQAAFLPVTLSTMQKAVGILVLPAADSDTA